MKIIGIDLDSLSNKEFRKFIEMIINYYYIQYEEELKLEEEDKND